MRPRSFTTTQRCIGLADRMKVASEKVSVPQFLAAKAIGGYPETRVACSLGVALFRHPKSRRKAVLFWCSNACRNQWKRKGLRVASLKAEGKGFEPSTGFPAPDFESGR